MQILWFVIALFINPNTELATSQTEPPCRAWSINDIEHAPQFRFNDNPHVHSVVAQQLHDLLDGRIGHHLYQDEQVATQILLAQSIPDHWGHRSLGDELYIFTGCRQHSCPEKSILIADKQGHVKAAGLIAIEDISRPDNEWQHALLIYTFVAQCAARNQSLIELWADSVMTHWDYPWRSWPDDYITHVEDIHSKAAQ